MKELNVMGMYIFSYNVSYIDNIMSVMLSNLYLYRVLQYLEIFKVLEKLQVLLKVIFLNGVNII